jgi:hypothetical protein
MAAGKQHCDIGERARKKARRLGKSLAMEDHAQSP